MKPSTIEEWQAKLATGLDINAPTESGRTPLNEEIFASRFEVACVLIAQGARVDLPSQCPLVEAAMRANPDFIRFLVELGADVNGTDQFGNRPLNTAVSWKRHENVVALIALGALCETGLVYSAALHNDFDTVKTLVEAGCDVNQTDAFGISKDSPLHMSLKVSNTEMAAYLLDHGANPLAEDWYGRRPFHLARAAGFDSLAAKLAASEPKEWHDVLICRQRLAGMGLPGAILDILGEENRRIDFSSHDSCVTNYIVFNTIVEVPHYTWENMRVLDLLQTVQNYGGSGLLCWFVDEGCLGTFDEEHKSWGFMKDLTIEAFLEKPAHHMNCIIQGGYTQFDPEFMDDLEEDE